MSLRNAGRFSLATVAVFCSLAVSCLAGGLTGKSAKTVESISSAVAPVDVSGSRILARDGDGHGLELVNGADGKVDVISRQNTASYGAVFSPDGLKVGYKAFDAQGNQQPTVYDIASKTYTTLATAPLTGTPAFSATGAVAYTVGSQLSVVPPSGDVSTYDLGTYVNLLAFSPDGKKVAFNDDHDQINILNLKSGKKKTLTHDKTVYYQPVFSPNGKKILARTLIGDVVTINAKSGKVRNLGKGDAPGWLDNQKIAMTRRSVIEGVAVESSSLVEVTAAGKVLSTLASAQGNAVAAVDHGNFAFSAQNDSIQGVPDTATGKIRFGYVNKSRSVASDVVPGSTSLTVISSASVAPRDVVDGASTVQLSNVPYIHQAYDTPDWWDGDWSCNATAALMAIEYYNILPKHPMTVSYPSTHTSDYGWYIPNQYTFNGHTFNIGSSDPLGTTGYGGYGYITQNGWEDTKGHMAEYISDHGPTSSVDWSPTFAEATAEVDANHPFVILTDLTSSGHYPLCIGYVKNQHTLIFNDPWGNKNISYPSTDGRNARYDWPGYNNGYQNLNTVYCYIWCRFGQPSAPSGLTASASGTTINLSWTDNSYCEANYDVYRSTTSGGSYTLVASLGANVTSWSNSGLSGSTTYYYVVRARNASGSSGNSNEASATTGGGATTIIVDNTDSGFSASANWSSGTSSSDKYGSSYRFRSTQAVSDAASWTFNVTSAGNYKIYAWWPQGSNRSQTAPYILPDGTSVHVNQQVNGGSWQLLGTQYLSTGSHNVRLSCWTTAGSVVIADAIKVTPQ